jgi:NAD(P)-dependent dehydrogenase (short-subunit alcohol dehydrogenase family)
MTIALVTGSNRRLGHATARALAHDGNTVIVTGRDDARVRDAAATLREEGLDVEALPLDVTSQSSIAAAVEHPSRSHRW